MRGNHAAKYIKQAILGPTRETTDGKLHGSTAQVLYPSLDTTNSSNTNGTTNNNSSNNNSGEHRWTYKTRLTRSGFEFELRSVPNSGLRSKLERISLTSTRWAGGSILRMRALPAQAAPRAWGWTRRGGGGGRGQRGSGGSGELETTCAWGADDCPFHLFLHQNQRDNLKGRDPQLTLDTHARTHIHRHTHTRCLPKHREGPGAKKQRERDY